MKEFIKPMISGELSRPFDNKEWLFEFHLGGFRVIASIEDNCASVYSHKNQIFNDDFPLLVNDLQKISINVVLDGEIVMLDENGKPDIQKLLSFRENGSSPVYYYAFDLLSFHGQSLLKVPLIQRKELLKKVIKNFEYVKYADHVIENGCDLFKSATKSKLEGIWAKKTDGLYYPGKKSNEWLKICNKSSKEVVICGFTKPSVKDKRIGALITGFEENGNLSYSGHVVAGLDEFRIQELYTQLIPLVTDTSPFNCEVKSKKDIIWVHPKIKCEVKYLDMAKDHRMFHPVFLSIKQNN